MACTPIGINQDNESCGSSDGGILQSFVIDFADIEAVTFGADDEITAITLEALATFEKFVYDDDDTAFFNSTGERTGKKHVFNQEAFMKFEGLSILKIKAINALRECCNTVWIHRLNSGVALVQGLEKDGSTFKRVKQSAKATTSILSDTGENVDRAEITVSSVCKTIHATTLTDAAIEALLGV